MPMTAQRVSEAREYHRTAEDFAAQPGNSKSITTMMRLACEGLTPHARRIAGRWLLMYLGVRVVESEDYNAAPSTAEAFC